MRISLIVGLPASGKTEYAKSLGADVLIDDPKKEDLINFPNKFNHMVITDPMFCESKVLESAVSYLSGRYTDSIINVTYFANNPEQCLKNAARRSNKPVDNLIILLSRIYNPPRNDLEVWRE